LKTLLHLTETFSYALVGTLGLVNLSF